MAHTKASADNSFALSTQTSYEMHKKTVSINSSNLCKKDAQCTLWQITGCYCKLIYTVSKKTFAMYSDIKTDEAKQNRCVPHPFTKTTTREEFSSLTERR